MTITITIDGTERTYRGDYYELHTVDWSQRIQDFLDDVKESIERV